MFECYSKFQRTDSDDGIKFFIGRESGAGSYANRNIFGFEGNHYWLGCYYVQTEVGTTDLLEHIVHFSTYGTAYIYIDDTELYSAEITTEGRTSYNIYIFGQSSGTYNTKARLFYCQILQNSTVIRNYVPCYCTTSVTAYKGSTQTTAASGTIGLYDLANSRFYINSGSGTFTKGPDV